MEGKLITLRLAAIWIVNGLISVFDLTFLQPSLTFALRAGFPRNDSLLVYRSHLVAAVRRICALPTCASTSYIFAHKRVGGLELAPGSNP